MRSVGSTCAVVVVFGLLALPASAATVGRSGGTLSFAAGPAEANRLTIVPSGGNVVVTDTGVASLTDGDGAGGCVVTGAMATCPLAGLMRVVATLADGDDVATVSAGLPATIDGGHGADRLTGGAAADTLTGGTENDTLDGRLGPDVMRGGTGVDTASYANRTTAVTVDDNDVANDGNIDDRANGVRDNVASDVENLVGGAGGDALTGNDAPNRIEGGPGRDTITGAPGADVLLGGDDNDVIDGGDDNDTVEGGGGDDFARLGRGSDSFRWDPADDSDTIEGDQQVDRIVFNGNDSNEDFSVSAIGGRVRLFRNIASVNMDLNGIETVDVNSAGGADNMAVDDLTGTDVDDVALDLGGGSQTDNVTVWGTAAADTMRADKLGGEVDVTGTPARVVVTHGQAANDLLFLEGAAGNDRLAANPDLAETIGLTLDGGGDDDTAAAEGTDSGDRFDLADGAAVPQVAVSGGVGQAAMTASTESLTIDGRGGADQVFAGALHAGATRLLVDAGLGNDVINGSQGPDFVIGSDGNDTMDGSFGDDIGLLGAGNDTASWSPAGGNDTFEGQDGTDRLAVRGANINERFTISPNGGRIFFTRDIASVVLDFNDLERIDLATLGGVDDVRVDDLTGTDVTNLAIDLGLNGVGDGAADHVTQTATPGDDNIKISAHPATGVRVDGLLPAVQITHPEAANDRLDVNTLTGNDLINTNQLEPGVMQIFVNGEPF